MGRLAKSLEHKRSVRALAQRRYRAKLRESNEQLAQPAINTSTEINAVDVNRLLPTIEADALVDPAIDQDSIIQHPASRSDPSFNRDRQIADTPQSFDDDNKIDDAIADDAAAQLQLQQELHYATHSPNPTVNSDEIDQLARGSGTSFADLREQSRNNRNCFVLSATAIKASVSFDETLDPSPRTASVLDNESPIPIRTSIPSPIRTSRYPGQ